MASDTQLLCLACGEGPLVTTNRRNILSSSSQHVIPLWRHMVEMEFERRNQYVALDIVLSASQHTFMCRKCFYAYEKVLKTQEVRITIKLS